MRWTFQPFQKMGGATGDAFANPLGGDLASLLAREALQNSVDAAAESSNGRPVRVLFGFRTFAGGDREQLFETLAIDLNFRKHLTLAGLPPQSLDNSTLTCLYIEDFETTGLTGDPHDPSSRFFRLLLSLGDTSKLAEQEGSGGSYGFGKSAYSIASTIRTIVAYTERPSGACAHSALLMGAAYMPVHRDDFKSRWFPGRAWLGVEEEGSGQTDSVIVHPFRDEEARRLAKAIGFTRTEGQIGTSIMIVACDTARIDPDDLISRIEDNWWPRLVDGRLQVTVTKGRESLTPRPKRRPDLLPFIACFTAATRSDGNPRVEVKTLNRHDGILPGKVGLQVLGEDTLGQVKEGGTIALIRNPRMVVSYHRPIRNSRARAIGVFVASPEADPILRLSEPPLHDSWNPHSQRLSDDQRKFVISLFKRLQRLMREASRSSQPTPEEDLPHLLILERSLGDLFRCDTQSNEDAGGAPALPIQIRFVKGPAIRPTGDGKVMLFGKVKVEVDAGRVAAEEVIRGSLRIRLEVIEEGRTSDSLLACQAVVLNGDDETLVNGHDLRTGVALASGRDCIAEFESEPYSSDWAVSVKASVEPDVAAEETLSS